MRRRNRNAPPTRGAFLRPMVTLALTTPMLPRGDTFYGNNQYIPHRPPTARKTSRYH